MAIHILLSDMPAHLLMEDIYNTKSNLDHQNDHVHRYDYLHILLFSSTAVSVLPDISNLYISAYVRYRLHYKQAQEDLPIGSNLC